MRLDEFYFDLPDSLIAQYPLQEREEARLLVVDRASRSLTHDIFKNIGEYLSPATQLVMNNSRVVHARLQGTKASTGASIEVFLLNKVTDEFHYEVLMKPMKRLKDGDQIVFPDEQVVAEVVDRERRLVKFNQANLTEFLQAHGHIPLPPYIKRADEELDRRYYQTVYASQQGSVAAPTAGLHFTEKILEQLKSAGHSLSEVTLHINYGTFKPVEVEEISKHQMHSEWYSVQPDVQTEIQQAKSRGQSILAVGTTSTRVLESMAVTNSLEGDTDIFIYPGYEFKYVDVLLTNFHLPQSTLIMLVSAFGGMDLIKQAYQEAIQKEYRFYSYGDAMLIL